MPVLHYNNIYPEIDNDAYIASNAIVSGDVLISKDVTILFGVTIRGDINQIIIEEGSNIQDSAVLHTTRGLGKCIVEKFVTIGHRAILHGCIIKHNSLIGMGSTILDNAVVEPYCIIGANSLVPMNKIIPSGHLAYGNPVKIIRKLTQEEKLSIDDTAERYILVGKAYSASDKS